MNGGRGRVLSSVDGQVATLVFDRPEQRNSMTWDMYEELTHHCDRIDRHPDVRVVVLRGAGEDAFVAGTDIQQFEQFTHPDDGVAYERRIEEVLCRLEQVRVPTIAAINGYAVGGGLMLAAACDLRIATRTARLGMPIARTLGNCLSMPNYARLIHLTGAARAAEILYTANLLDAERAREAGLLTRVVNGDQLPAEVSDLCGRLISHAPLTMATTKVALRRLRTGALPEDEDLIRTCYGSRDFREGVAAFIEKRTPRWSGR